MKAVHKNPSDWTAENIAAFWDWQSKNLVRQQQYFTATLAPGIVKFLNKKRLLKGDVLDYGCGAGHLLQQMVKKDTVNFYGLDFSTDSIEETKKRIAGKSNLKQLVLADELPSAFKDEQFDLITLIETIEHLQDETLQQTMQELYRLLKPGGQVFITTPFNQNLDEDLAFCPFCKSEFHQMQHMQTFNIASLHALAARHGFKGEEVLNIDIQKLKLGPVKYFVKQLLVKLAITARLKDAVKNKTPNLIAFFVKPGK